MSSPPGSEPPSAATRPVATNRSGGPVRADYHVHTRYSHDSSTPLDVVLERAAAASIGCVCVTDHDTIEGAVELKRIAPADVEIIVGCEFTIDDGSHVIGLGLAEAIREKRFEVLTERIREQGGLVVLPHPFRRSSGIFRAELRRSPAFVQGVLSVADAVECFNAGDTYEHNRSNLGLVEQYGVAAVAGSDAHTPAAIGSVFVEYADAQFTHGASPRGIFFGAQLPSREHAAKRWLMEQYHARKTALPGFVNAAYRGSKRALRRTVAARSSEPPALQYRLAAAGSPRSSDDS